MEGGRGGDRNGNSAHRVLREMRVQAEGGKHKTPKAGARLVDLRRARRPVRVEEEKGRRHRWRQTGDQRPGPIGGVSEAMVGSWLHLSSFIGSHRKVLSGGVT